MDACNAVYLPHSRVLQFAFSSKELYAYYHTGVSALPVRKYFMEQFKGGIYACAGVYC